MMHSKILFFHTAPRKKPIYFEFKRNWVTQIRHLFRSTLLNLQLHEMLVNYDSSLLPVLSLSFISCINCFTVKQHASKTQLIFVRLVKDLSNPTKGGKNKGLLQNLDHRFLNQKTSHLQKQVYQINVSITSGN